MFSGISSNSTVMSSMIAKPSDDGNCTNWFMPKATESLTGVVGIRSVGCGADRAGCLRFAPAGTLRGMPEAAWLCERRAASPCETMPRSALRLM